MPSAIRARLGTESRQIRREGSALTVMLVFALALNYLVLAALAAEVAESRARLARLVAVVQLYRPPGGGWPTDRRD